MENKMIKLMYMTKYRNVPSLLHFAKASSKVSDIGDTLTQMSPILS